MMYKLVMGVDNWIFKGCFMMKIENILISECGSDQ